MFAGCVPLFLSVFASLFVLFSSRGFRCFVIHVVFCKCIKVCGFLARVCFDCGTYNINQSDGIILRCLFSLLHSKIVCPCRSNSCDTTGPVEFSRIKYKHGQY